MKTVYTVFLISFLKYTHGKPVKTKWTKATCKQFWVKYHSYLQHWILWNLLHTCVRVYTHALTHTHTHMHTHAHTRKQEHTCMLTHTHAHTHTAHGAHPHRKHTWVQKRAAHWSVILESRSEYSLRKLKVTVGNKSCTPQYWSNTSVAECMKTA